MEEQVKQVKFADFGPAPGKRGRPTKKTVADQDDWNKLTDQEKFQVLKAELIKDLHTQQDALDPVRLRDMVKHRMDFATGKHHEWGEKLWGRLLLQRGKFREANKDLGKCETTVFGSITVHKFADGLQLELPMGYSLKQKKNKHITKVNDAIKAYEYINEIMM